MILVTRIGLQSFSECISRCFRIQRGTVGQFAAIWKGFPSETLSMKLDFGEFWQIRETVSSIDYRLLRRKFRQCRKSRARREEAARRSALLPDEWIFSFGSFIAFLDIGKGGGSDNKGEAPVSLIAGTGGGGSVISTSCSGSSILAVLGIGVIPV